jgi:hypothetical protein
MKKNFLKTQKLLAVESLMKADTTDKIAKAGLSLIDILLFRDYFVALLVDDSDMYDLEHLYPEAFQYLSKYRPEWISLGLLPAFSFFYDPKKFDSYSLLEVKIVSMFTKALAILGNECLYAYRDLQDISEVYLDEGEFALEWFKGQISSRRVTVISLGKV